MRIIGIQRDERFSPNAADKDLAILKAVVEPLGGEIVREAELATLSDLSDQSDKSGLSDNSDQPSWLIFSMARSRAALARLRELAAGGARVINPPEGVEACRRSHLVSMMRKLDIPQPSERGDHGYWLKRGDAAAESAADVCFCADEVALAEAQAAMRERGVTDQVVQAHVEGDLVKFYGVEGTGFFRCYYPTDDGLSKFGDEQRNGSAQHYAFSRHDLQQHAERLSRAVTTPVYGGDAIIDKNGAPFIIDFNDWPSFSRCCEEAAEAIRELGVRN